MNATQWCQALFEAGPSRLRKLGGWRRALAVTFTGVLGAASMAPLYWLPLLAVAFSALIIFLDGASAGPNPRRRAFWTGWFFGLGYFVAGIYWMSFSFFVQAEQFAWMAPFAMFGLPSFLAIFTGAACAVAMSFWRPGWRRIAIFAGVYMLFEYARGHVLTGLPWNLPAQSLAGFAPAAQTAAWYGAYGLSLVITLLAAAPAAWIGAGLPVRRAALGSVLLVAGFIGLIVVGWLRIDGRSGDANDVYVRVVQPNIPQREKIDSSLWGRNIDRQLALSVGDYPDAEKIFVIWPENGAPLLDEAPSALAAMGEALPQNAVVLAGAVRRARDSSGKMRVYNSIAVTAHTDQGRQVTAHYDKHHLVPFGEYLPFQGFLRAVGLAQLAPFDDGFTPGVGPRVMNAGGPSFAPLICYEAIFPGDLYPDGERPEWLVTVTNDAWFGDTSGPRQHFDQARLRSIESGLPMVRSANTGISAVIDSYGRVIERISLYKSGRIDAPLPAPLPPTIYERLGDSLFFAMTILLLCSTIVPVRRSAL